MAEAKREQGTPIEGFALDKPPMQRGKVIKILQTRLRFDTGENTIQGKIEEMVKGGANVAIGGGLHVGGVGYTEKQLTKGGMDYAAHLIQMRDDPDYAGKVEQARVAKDRGIEAKAKAASDAKEAGKASVAKERDDRWSSRTANYDTFLATYIENRKRLHDADPVKNAAFGADGNPDLSAEVASGLLRGGNYSKDGPALEATYRQLGINNTYKDIQRYMTEEPKVKSDLPAPAPSTVPEPTPAPTAAASSQQQEGDILDRSGKPFRLIHVAIQRKKILDQTEPHKVVKVGENQWVVRKIEPVVAPGAEVSAKEKQVEPAQEPEQKAAIIPARAGIKAAPVSDEARDLQGAAPIAKAEWIKAGVKEGDIQEWEREGLTPTDANEAQGRGTDLLRIAIGLRRFREESAEKAKPWIAVGVPEDMVSAWEDAGLTPADAALTRDHQSPFFGDKPYEVADKIWKAKGFNPNQRDAWQDRGFSLEEAVEAKSKGMSPSAAEKAVLRKEKEEAQGAGITPRPSAPPAPDKPEGYGQGNKIFTQDAADKARERLRKKLAGTQLNSGIDPELFTDGVLLAGYHIEAGARSFAAYSKTMLANLGETAKPYLRSWYEGARHYPGIDQKGMTPASELDQAVPGEKTEKKEATKKTYGDFDPAAEAAKTGIPDAEPILHAYAELGGRKGQHPIRIYAMREKAGLSTAEFDQALQSLLDRDWMEGYTGNPSDLTDEQQKNSFTVKGSSAFGKLRIGVTYWGDGTPATTAQAKGSDHAGHTNDVFDGHAGEGTQDVPGTETGRGSQRVPGPGGSGRSETDRGDAGRSGKVTGGELQPQRPGDRGRDGDGVPAGTAHPVTADADIQGENHVITPGSQDEGRGWTQKAKDNLAAVKLVEQIADENRFATREEQTILARFVGWGGLSGVFPNGQGKYGSPTLEKIGQELKTILSTSEYATARRSTQYAHYTSETIVSAMWQAVERMGFQGGKVFEPGMGIGNFAGLMPADIAARSSYMGIEFDHLTARIAKLLYPNHGVVREDFKKAMVGQNQFDLVIGNPPFSDSIVSEDPAYKQQGFVLHDYFFAKSMEALRPGGILAFVTSTGTLNKADPKARNFLAAQADFVGAIRLPGNAFEKNAGTSVSTDIIFLRKRLPGEPPGDASWTKTESVRLPNKHGVITEGVRSRYFGANPDMILGEEGFFGELHPGGYSVRAIPGEEIKTRLAEAIDRLQAGIAQPLPQSATPATPTTTTPISDSKNGSFLIGQDGRLMQIDGGKTVEVVKRGGGVKGGMVAKDFVLIKGLIPIRDALREVYAADMAGDAAGATQARQKLNKTYDAFVRVHGPINKTEYTFRDPTTIQQEAARNAAREEAMDRDGHFDEGSFNPTAMLNAGATNTEIARARQVARATHSSGEPWSEGDFDPADMDQIAYPKYPNVQSFMSDPESYRLRAIENYNRETGTATKGEVFTRNIISRDIKPQIKSVNDAALYVMNHTGRMDLPMIAHEVGLPIAQVIEELGERVYKTPGSTNTWVSREEYLSGNVKTKLKEAQAAAQRNPDFRRNVEALEKVQPRPVPPTDIHVGLGSNWVPTTTIAEFATKALGLSNVEVKYLPITDTWTVLGNPATAAARSTWGTDRMDALTLLENALNHRGVGTLYSGKDEDGRNIPDPVATQAATDKMFAIKERFGEWAWEDKGRAGVLAEIYNDKFNNNVVRQYTGDYLTTPGVVQGFKWYNHQKSVIARIIQDGNTYIAHAVGAGKTSAKIGSGMEMRRLGLVNKPMYVVPNHMLTQFTVEFYRQYPSAKIAVADETQFHTGRRKQFIADVATSDLDGIVITHAAFGKIPVSSQYQERFVDQQLDEYRDVLKELRAAGENSRSPTVKQIENAIEKLEQRLLKRGAKETDQVFTFEEMGVDFLIVDEAHEFRKLDFATKQSNLKGIDPNGSAKAWDLYMKTRYLDERNPGRSLVMASGTPITNTMGELYTLSRYMQPKALEQAGVASFDAWAGLFGDTVKVAEQLPTGGLKEVTRFAKFVNLPELSTMVRGVMDIVTSHQLGDVVKRPALVGGERKLHVSERTEPLIGYQAVLEQRMKAIEHRSGPAVKGDDIFLSIISDGRLAAIDMRFIDPTLPSDPSSKLNVMISNVFQIWEKTRDQTFYIPGTDRVAERGPAAQMVFSNLGINNARGFGGYAWMIRELTRKGIPRDQIAIIGDYKSHVARQRLFDAVNAGQVRVLIGSSAKMGTGVNAQKRLYAVHNLDPVWYPSDDEQRVGRILRQGNLNPQVEVHDYTTKGTYDAAMWGMMETKAKFTEAFYRGDPNIRTMEDLGEASLYEQAKALSSSDTRAFELTKLNQELATISRRQSAFEREQANIQWQITQAEKNLAFAQRNAKNIRQDMADRQDLSGNKFLMRIGGQAYTDRTKAGNALWEALNEVYDPHLGPYNDHEVTVGTFGTASIVGVSLHAKYHKEADGVVKKFNATLITPSGRHYNIDDSSPASLIPSISAIPRNFEQHLTNATQDIAKYEKNLADYSKLTGNEFKGGEAIPALKAKIRELRDSLMESVKTSHPAVFEGDTTEQADVRFSIMQDTPIPGSRQSAALEQPEPTRQATDRLEGAINPILEKWSEGPKVVISPTGRELPQRILAEMAGRGYDPDLVESVFDAQTGTIHMVASAFATPQRAQAVLLHEAVAHFGLRSLLGETRLNTLLDNVSSRFTREMQEIARHRGLDLSSPAGRREAAEEHLATLAEQGGQNGFLTRLWSLIRSGLRAVGFNLVLNNGDLRTLLAMSAKGLESRQGGEAKGARHSLSQEGGNAALERDSAEFERQVDAFLKGTDDASGRMLRLGDTPAIMQMLGALGLPLHISKGVVRKVLQDKHAVPVEIFKHLPRLLAAPTMVLRSATHPEDSLVVVLNAKDADGDRVVASIHMGTGDVKINSVSSVYGKDNPNWFKAQVDAGRLLYIDQQKSTESLRPQGTLQLPKEKTIGALPESILTESDLVNFKARRPDIRYSLKPTTMSKPLEGVPDRTDAQKAVARKFGADSTGMLARMAQDPKGAVKNFGNWMANQFIQGTFDQYYALRKADAAELGTSLEKSAWVRAVMSSTAPDAIEKMIKDGIVQLDESGALSVQSTNGPGGKGLGQAFKELGTGELEGFLLWVAGKRADSLKAEGRERWLSDEDIATLASFSDGKMKNGESRLVAYNRARVALNAHLNATLNVAEQSGILNKESRALWQSEWYLPFYRVIDEEQQNTHGPVDLNALVNQEGIHRLRGSNKQVGDLLANLMMNFNHLLSASLRNNAAKTALERGQRTGAATRISAPFRASKEEVFHLENGQRVWYSVTDPQYLAAVSAISWEGLRGAHMDVLRAFKRALTYGVTLDPAFRVANLLKDSIIAASLNEMSINPAINVANGIKAIRANAPEIARLQAAGAFFRGIQGEDHASLAKRLRGMVVDVDSPKGWATLGQAFSTIFDKYQKIGQDLENVNRVAGGMHDLGQGKSLLAAAFHSRDQMNFAMTGGWPAVRFLAQTIPFFNARLQGLYKMGRMATDPDARGRFATVATAYTAASVALYLLFADDDRVKDRPEEERDAYHIIPVGDIVFRIPKPFEIGTIATIAERIAQQFVDDEATGELFRQRLIHAVTETLNFGVVPGAFKPGLALYANKDSYTGMPIETAAMKNLTPTERVGEHTTATAKGVSQATGGALSPVQVDHLVRGYLGWLGTTAMALSGAAWDMATSDAEKPDMRLDEMPVVGRFVREAQSRRTKHERTFYENLNAAEEVMATIRHLRRTGRKEDAATLADENQETLGLRGGLTTDSKALRKINAEILQIRTDDSLNGGQKRQQLDALFQQRNAITSKAVANIHGHRDDEYQFKEMVYQTRDREEEWKQLRQESPAEAYRMRRTDMFLRHSKAISMAEDQLGRIDKLIRTTQSANMPEHVRQTRLDRLARQRAEFLQRMNKNLLGRLAA